MSRLVAESWRANSPFSILAVPGPIVLKLFLSTAVRDCCVVRLQNLSAEWSRKPWTHLRARNKFKMKWGLTTNGVDKVHGLQFDISRYPADNVLNPQNYLKYLDICVSNIIFNWRILPCI